MKGLFKNMDLENKYVVFPTDKINKGEKIAIYGAGMIGRCLVEQLKATNYCRVEVLIDQEASKIIKLEEKYILSSITNVIETIKEVNWLTKQNPEYWILPVVMGGLQIDSKIMQKS